MAWTSWDRADAFRAQCPHTFNALQHLVMAMAKVYRSRGKRTLFGRDKGLAAYKEFEDKLRDSVLAMVLDGLIERNVSAQLAREQLIEAIRVFSTAFPNWPDAYAFAGEFFVDSPAVSEDRIQSILR